jgi:hypothetical protein
MVKNCLMLSVFVFTSVFEKKKRKKRIILKKEAKKEEKKRGERGKRGGVGCQPSMSF